MRITNFYLNGTNSDPVFGFPRTIRCVLMSYLQTGTNSWRDYGNWLSAIDYRGNQEYFGWLLTVVSTFRAKVGLWDHKALYVPSFIFLLNCPIVMKFWSEFHICVVHPNLAMLGGEDYYCYYYYYYYYYDDDDGEDGNNKTNNSILFYWSAGSTIEWPVQERVHHKNTDDKKDKEDIYETNTKNTQRLK